MNLSFSGAMRRGHEIFTKQITGRLGDGNGGACALGHALGAVGESGETLKAAGMAKGSEWVTINEGLYNRIFNEWPITQERRECRQGLCRGFISTIRHLVWHMNDSHRMSVDEIADVVQGWENEAKAPKVEVKEEAAAL